MQLAMSWSSVKSVLEPCGITPERWSLAMMSLSKSRFIPKDKVPSLVGSIGYSCQVRRRFVAILSPQGVQVTRLPIHHGMVNFRALQKWAISVVK